VPVWIHVRHPQATHDAELIRHHLLVSDATEASDDRRTLPSDVDPEVWFTSSRAACRGSRDYLFDKHWLTNPGRIAAYCPHDEKWPDYRISLSELPEELPAATRYWVAGFLAGNLPAAPVAEDDSPEMRRWSEKAVVFANEGCWPLPGEAED
jgi:hypothetical protein